MRNRWLFFSLTFVALCLFVPQESFAQSTVTCNSDDMNRHICPADTRGGVRLATQHSDSPCTEGSTWGYDYQGIWVDRGCRADFTVGGNRDYGYGGNGQTQTISCNSNDMGRNSCAVDTRGGVRLVAQHSDSPCTEGSTWGYDNHGIWVDRGCRADFAVGGNRDYGYSGNGQTQTITCNSNDMNRNFCPADTRGGVRLAAQHSDSPCTEGSTWGYDNQGIWVDRGCRADFTVGGNRDYGYSGNGQTQTISCNSDDMKRHSCAVRTRGGVTLIHQRSEAACTEGYSWGTNRRGIWVDHGCRADFVVGARGNGGYRP